MLSAGCKVDINTASVLSFIQTEALNDDIKKLVSSDMRQVDTCDCLMVKDHDFYGIDAFFIEAGHSDTINDNLELVKKIRLVNYTACIFILITNTKAFSSINYYLAGADHCIKLPSDADDKAKLLSRTLDDSHWKKTTQLILDRTRLLLSSSTSKLEISYTEMTIIDALLRAPNHALSQDDIAKTLDPNIVFYDPRALEKTISRLRTKIKKAYHLELIFSVRAFGYRLRRGTVSG
ncbi:response regulator receiver protein [Pseudomonas versuta]|uniref:Response regulator receiver protein n=1 Tax=Pseudomonas versuta TaxID=1788301 RepID=A0A854A7J3_9PSED|nr:helix-turn-helix domain-containing protein [Pseudomonas versuta]OKA27110.1 response regulator receiver protein [Pseudomonas versuta]